MMNKLALAIPIDIKDRLIQHEVRQTINHLNVLTWVAASRGVLCPVIITWRKGPNNGNYGGHRPGKDFIIERNHKPYVDDPLFECFIRHRFVPSLRSMRTIPCHCRADAVLMMDSDTSHITGEIFRLLGEDDVKVITFSPPATNLFHARDLSFFSVFKTKDTFGCSKATIKRVLRPGRP
jgi:hypothetical protein